MHYRLPVLSLVGYIRASLLLAWKLWNQDPPNETRTFINASKYVMPPYEF